MKYCTELGAKSPDVPSIVGARGLPSYLNGLNSFISLHDRKRLETFPFLLNSFLSFPSRESGYRCSEFAGTKAWHIRIYGAQLRIRICKARCMDIINQVINTTDIAINSSGVIEKARVAGEEGEPAILGRGGSGEVRT